MEYIIQSFLNIKFTDVIDILVVAFLLYTLINYIMHTRAMQLLKGLLIILLVWLVAELFSFTVVKFLIRNFMTLGIIFLVIVFQPELRLMLERLGRGGGTLVTGPLSNINKDSVEITIDQMLEAISDLAISKTGAIIVLEMDSGLTDIAESGEIINARVNSELIKNIFFKNAPLHDGAVLIKNEIIVAASCLLPLSRDQSIGKELGTRHRAALGLAERSDAIIIVISEETGTISVAQEGRLSRFVDLAGLESLLKSKLTSEKKTPQIFEFFDLLKREKSGDK